MKSRGANPLATFGLALVLTACSSKLPGPAECEVVALRAVGVRELDQLRFPHVRSAVEQMTHECLVLPFDREITRCTDELPFSHCLREFARRHPDRASRLELPR